MIILTQNRQCAWNSADISRIYVTGTGKGIQAVTPHGSGGEVAQYRDRERCTYVLGMLAAAVDAGERSFVFPAETELEHARTHTSSGGGARHGGS